VGRVLLCKAHAWRTGRLILREQFVFQETAKQACFRSRLVMQGNVLVQIVIVLAGIVQCGRYTGQQYEAFPVSGMQLDRIVQPNHFHCSRLDL